jgi:hypothetical protein
VVSQTIGSVNVLSRLKSFMFVSRRTPYYKRIGRLRDRKDHAGIVTPSCWFSLPTFGRRMAFAELLTTR